MPQSLIVIIDSVTTMIPNMDIRYGAILKVLSEGLDEKKIADIVKFNDNTDKDERIKIKPEENKVLIDGMEMPAGLQKRFMDLKRRHKPRAYLLTFWDKLQKNPNKNSIKMLYSFLEHNGHPIMADGSFIAYKAVRWDTKDHHSNTNEHKVGKVLRMERKDVDADPHSLCSTGLHVASWAYMKHFQDGNSRYFEVLVNPTDVVAVPNDYDGTKMRVCAYKVYREIKGERIEDKLTTQTKALQQAVKKKFKK
jgi:hypothetical protein